nr:teichoic acid D-Ala incorporation-associated protein DltX [Liquorilactobacillus satsumensis]
MGGQWRSRLLHSEVTKFVLKTIFYFVVMLILVYLYSYSGINGPHFIYNEF